MSRTSRHNMILGKKVRASAKVPITIATTLDHVTSELHKRTFINRMLFTNCYCLWTY